MKHCFGGNHALLCEMLQVLLFVGDLCVEVLGLVSAAHAGMPACMSAGISLDFLTSRHNSHVS